MLLGQLLSAMACLALSTPLLCGAGLAAWSGEEGRRMDWACGAAWRGVVGWVGWMRWTPLEGEDSEAFRAAEEKPFTQPPNNNRQRGFLLSSSLVWQRIFTVAFATPPLSEDTRSPTQSHTPTQAPRASLCAASGDPHPSNKARQVGYCLPFAAPPPQDNHRHHHPAQPLNHGT